MAGSNCYPFCSGKADLVAQAACGLDPEVFTGLFMVENGCGRGVFTKVLLVLRSSCDGKERLRNGSVHVRIWNSRGNKFMGRKAYEL